MCYNWSNIFYFIHMDISVSRWIQLAAPPMMGLPEHIPSRRSTSQYSGFQQIAERASLPLLFCPFLLFSLTSAGQSLLRRPKFSYTQGLSPVTIPSTDVHAETQWANSLWSSYPAVPWNTTLKKQLLHVWMFQSQIRPESIRVWIISKVPTNALVILPYNPHKMI